MKILLFSMISACYGMHEIIGNVTRNRMLKTVRNRGFKNSCRLLFVERDYVDRREEDQPIECELRGKDGTFKMLRIKGFQTDWLKNSNFKSGMTKLFAADFIIDDDTNELIIPSSQRLKIGPVKKVSNNSPRPLNERPEDSMNRNSITGTKTVLVIRAVLGDSSTTASEETLSDDIFGTLGDTVNLKSQYSQCSDGQLLFEPLTTHSLVGTDGVYTVNLPGTFVSGASDGTIRDAMVNQAIADLGAPLETIANHVMLCLPPGTGDWVAYAYIDNWLSVYNDAWCQYPSAQLHELGHNLNLGHSNDRETAYGDQSGMMGFSYSEDDTPLMCFNGPKTYQLGWYSQYHVDLPMNGSYNWNGNLVGFAEKSSASSSDKMIVRIATSTTDIYVHFNRMIGMNSGTKEGGDHVLVTTRSPGTEYAESTVEAALGSNWAVTVPNFNGSWSSLKISVESITTTTVPGYATISIQFDESVPTVYTASAPITTQASAFTTSLTPPTAITSALISPTQLMTMPPFASPSAMSIPPFASPTAMSMLHTTPTQTPKTTTQSNCNFNSICEIGEDCNSCPFDCNGRKNDFCCVGDHCDDIKCNIHGWHCT